MNEDMTYQVLQKCVEIGVREFIVCAGSRNSSFVQALRVEERLNTIYWPEERSASFFAMGRSRLTDRPVAIITTSGTAAGELLPAAMEAYYSGVPLILITADRPLRFRGSGAPQSAEQLNLFGHYTKYSIDITPETVWNFNDWNKEGPIHLNVCLEDPKKEQIFQGRSFIISDCSEKQKPEDFKEEHLMLDAFFSKVKNPIVIVSTLKAESQDSVIGFLLRLNIPVFLEGISGLRENPAFESMSIFRLEKILEHARDKRYEIDGILRIGGVPTHGIWRELEYLKEKIKVCSCSEQPFSGLSWNRMLIKAPIGRLLENYLLKCKFSLPEKFIESETHFQEQLLDLFKEESSSEPSLIHDLSYIIPKEAHIYLGNSLPIREWDLAASRQEKKWVIYANRGLNGIDGQLSTFLGMCKKGVSNWGIFGDLTTLYDMASCWVLNQMEEMDITIVVINNSGGQIFKRLFPHKEMLNLHQLRFKPLAEFWGLEYESWEAIPKTLNKSSKKLIEIIPDEEATTQFWLKYENIGKKQAAEVVLV